MPCTKCKEGKYKWGERGECEYDTMEECKEANPDHHYEEIKPTRIVELVITDDNQDLAIDAISLVTAPAIEQDFVYFNKSKNNLTLAKVDEDKRVVVSPALIPFFIKSFQKNNARLQARNRGIMDFEFCASNIIDFLIPK